jgi:hypothetical protein
MQQISTGQLEGCSIEAFPVLPGAGDIGNYVLLSLEDRRDQPWLRQVLVRLSPEEACYLSVELRSSAAACVPPAADLPGDVPW